ncbi:MAG: hypothetical protein ACOC6C_03415 [Verrucomicrobiota bacterium]
MQKAGKPENDSLFNSRTFTIRKNAGSPWRFGQGRGKRWNLLRDLKRSSVLAGCSRFRPGGGNSRTYFFDRYRGEIHVTDVTNWTV